MVLEKVTTLISEQFNIDEEDITEDTAFEEIGADDVDIEELAIAIEGEFDITLHREEINSISKVSDLINIVETAISLA